MEDDIGDSREERAFRLWINSMGLEDGDDKLHINNLFSECRDGLLLLKVMDRVQPGCVVWSKVVMAPKNKFHRVSNCNEVVRIAKEVLRFSVVGIGGVDLVDGNKKLTLSIVWQLMHHHITQFLIEVHKKKFGVARQSSRSSLIGGKLLNPNKSSDDMIIQWANRRILGMCCVLLLCVYPPEFFFFASLFVSALLFSLFHFFWAAPPFASLSNYLHTTTNCLVVKSTELSTEQAAQAKTTLAQTSYSYPYDLMKSFGDSKLSDSLFFMHLLWALAPRVVNWQLVHRGKTEEEKLQNAR